MTDRSVRRALPAVARAALLGAAVLSLAASSDEGKQPVAPALDKSAMVEIRAGSFSMGPPPQKPGRYGDDWFVDQTPQHRVTLDAFWIDRYEVTVAEFALFLSRAGGEAHYRKDQPIDRVDGGYLAAEGKGKQPIRQVTWQAAAHYCAWAGKRLPSEAEWERAAAGSSGRPFPWSGKKISCARAVYFTGASFCARGPQDVGERAAGATPEGVHDLAGNVAEWTADFYGPYESGAQQNPHGPSRGDYRVVRGGGFLDTALWLRSYARRAVPPALHSSAIGFRCAWSEDVDSDSARRGELSPPADEGRKHVARRSESAPLPRVVASGLGTPTALASLGGSWYLLDAAGGRVVSVDAKTGAKKTVLDGLDQAGGLDAGGGAVYATDTATGKVWRLTPGSTPSAIAAGEKKPGLVAANSRAVVWAAGGSLRIWRGSGKASDLASGVSTVADLRLAGGHAYFVDNGDSSKSRLARVPIGGGALETLVEIPSRFEAASLAVDTKASRIYYGIDFSSFPNTSFVCTVALGGGRLDCPYYGPPQMGPLALAKKNLVWATRRTLLTREPGKTGPYRIRVAWTRASDLLVDRDTLLWPDRDSGELLRLELAKP